MAYQSGGFSLFDRKVSPFLMCFAYNKIMGQKQTRKEIYDFLNSEYGINVSNNKEFKKLLKKLASSKETKRGEQIIYKKNKTRVIHF